MSLRTILVHLDHGTPCAGRVDLAAALARRHDARLVGLLPSGLHDGTIPAALLAPGGDDFIAGSAHFLRVRSEAIAQVFEDRVRQAGLLSHEVRKVDGTAVDALVRHARASDLVVVGQVGQHATERDPTLGVGVRTLPQDVALGAGRPVLVVPSTGRFADAGQRVLVAWDGSREAAMALRDVLQLVDRTSRLWLMSMHVDEPIDDETLQIGPVLAWLARHGIVAEAHRQASSIDFAGALRSNAAASGADLLVMGCHGHSRLRELLLGGVTHAMMAHLHLPVLMSH